MATKTKRENKSGTSKVLHFSVYGEHITWLLRHLWVEGNEVKALKMWNVTFPDFATLEGCKFFLQIVSGKKKFVGVNEFDIVKDGTKYWDVNRDGKPNKSFPLLQSWDDVIKLKQLKLFLAEVRLRHFRMRRMFGEDLASNGGHAIRWMNGADENKIENPIRQEVNKHYVDIKNLTRQFLPEKNNVLPILDDENPLLTGPTYVNKKDYKTFDLKMEGYHNMINYLLPIKKYFDKKYGSIATFSDSEIKMFFGLDDCKNIERMTKVDAVYSDAEIVSQRVNNMPLNIDVESFVKSQLKESERTKIEEENVQVTEWRSGYIDREGQFYGCSDLGHKNFAEEICKQFNIDDLDFVEEDEEQDYQITLDKKGWVKVSIGRFFWDTHNAKVTEAQKSTIWDFITAKGITETNFGDALKKTTFMEAFKEE